MRFALVCLPLVLVACAGKNQLDDTKGVAVEDVLRRIKAEVGLFQSHEEAYIKDSPLPNTCKGYVNFYIPKVTMTLSTILTVTTSGTASLGPPLPTAYKLGLSGGASKQGKQTQTLTFSEFPIEPLPPASVQDDMDELVKNNIPTPLTNALDGLRSAILNQSNHGPCFDLRQGDDDPKNTISFTIDVDNKNNSGLNFTYTMFSLGAARSGENDYSNKIEISFAPYLNPRAPGGRPRKPMPAPGKPVSEPKPAPGPIGCADEHGIVPTPECASGTTSIPRLPRLFPFGH